MGLLRRLVVYCYNGEEWAVHDMVRAPLPPPRRTPPSRYARKIRKAPVITVLPAPFYAPAEPIPAQITLRSKKANGR